jgi:hypothetical protein
MTQAQINRAVAAATGESRREIGRIGFSLVKEVALPVDPEPSDVAKFLDWDRVSHQRFSQLGLY